MKNYGKFIVLAAVAALAFVQVGCDKEGEEPVASKPAGEGLSPTQGPSAAPEAKTDAAPAAPALADKAPETPPADAPKDASPSGATLDPATGEIVGAAPAGSSLPPVPPVPASSDAAAPSAPVVVETAPPTALPAAVEAPTQLPPQVQQQAKEAHEQSAMLAVGEIKSLLTAKDYAKALSMSASAGKDYADTLVAGEFASLEKQAREGAGAGEPVAATPEAKTAAFTEARNAGIAAMSAKDYTGAEANFQKALRQQDDPETRQMVQLAASAGGPPRIAVAEFATVGDVGIPDAGKIVPELMLSKFDARRFQLVERSRLNAALAEQGLTVGQIEENPAVVRVKPVTAARYLVVGAVGRLGTLVIAARLVDLATGDVVQSADVSANDAVGLQNSLSELAAMLQMTNDEKANYLAMKARQQEAAVATASTDPAAIAAEQQRQQEELEAQRRQMAAQQAEEFARAQRERDAQAAQDQAQGLAAAGDYAGALQVAQWAGNAFGDTSLGGQFGGLITQITGQQQEEVVIQRDGDRWQRIRAERAARHARYLQFRDQGLMAMNAGDLPTAMAAFQAALAEENNPDVRGLLDQVVRRMQAPSVAVADFEIRGDFGMHGRAGAFMADVLLRELNRRDPRLMPIGRGSFGSMLARVGLRMEDAMREPAQPRMRALRGMVRFVVVGVGTTRKGSFALSASMVDLEAGRVVQSADVAASDVRALQPALADLAAMLLMDEGARRDYQAQRAYADWMARGDACAAAGRWPEALEAFRQAYRIRPTQDAMDHMTAAARQMQGYGKHRQEYDEAMRAGAAAARASEWGRAMDCYRAALALFDTAEARAGFEDARRHVVGDERERRRLYGAAMADAEAAARAGDWGRALAMYRQAFQIEPTEQAKAGMNRAAQALQMQAAEKDRGYAQAMEAARAAIRAGNWAAALEAFTRAASFKSTPETSAGISMARRKLAEQQVAAKAYEAAMAEAAAAGRAGDWLKALEAYTRAANLMNTPEARNGIATARRELAQGETRKRLYDEAMAQAASAARAGHWAEALAAYRRAYEIQKTREAAAGIAQASKMLTDAQYNRRQYEAAMAAAEAAARAGDWAKALAAYQQAASIEATPQARSGIERARQALAAASAADKHKEYERLMRQGDLAGSAGNWQAALAAYEKAAAIENTREAQAKILTAKKKLAEAGTAANAQKEYARLMQAGDAAAQAGDWQKALQAYEAAAAIENTRAVQMKIANAKKKLAEAGTAANAQKEYTRLVQAGDAAAQAGDWQKALQAYEAAAAIENTRAVQAKIANAKKKLAEATTANNAQRLEYARLMKAGDAAAQAGDWAKALEAYEAAAKIENTPAVQAKIVNAKKKLADAGAQRAEYQRLMQAGDAAAQAGDWAKALQAYQAAAAIENTRAVQMKIANAKKKLQEAAAASSAAAAQKAEYQRLLQAGDAAVQSGDWAKALQAYEAAAAIENNRAVQAKIANAKKKLQEAAAASSAAAAQKAEYQRLMQAGDAAAQSGNWALALQNYQAAAAIENTRAVQAKIANAKKKLQEAASSSTVGPKGPEATVDLGRKRQYAQAVAAAKAAMSSQDWAAAIEAWKKVQGIDDTAEAKTGLNQATNKLFDKHMADAKEAVRDKHWQPAADAYTRALELKPNSDAAKAGLAAAKKKLGQ